MVRKDQSTGDHKMSKVTDNALLHIADAIDKLIVMQKAIIHKHKKTDKLLKKLIIQLDNDEHDDDDDDYSMYG